MTMTNPYECDLSADADRAAVRAVALTRSPQRNALLTVFGAAGDTGLTYEQAAEVLGWTHTRKCWWKRCSDLRELGWIERHGVPQTRVGSQGTDCAVYLISPSGLAALRALDTPTV